MRKVALLGFLAVFYLAVSLAVFGQSVSASGSLTYEYPIKTPPGAGGMAPSLSLVYDSAMGNGILGMGWAIKGLSAITRDPTYQITFNDDLDHFLYDGQKLVKGADGLYQTKTETFLRIQFVYPNSTASYWTVTDKRGRTIYFGDSSDSHVDAVGRPGRARVWAESRLQDTMGNYITVTYNNETSTGAYYPDRILYTKNDTNQPLLFNAINFSYEPRADAFSTYMPSGVNTNERLRWVSVLCGVNASGTNGTLVRKYSLDYRYSISTGRTQLVSIREYGNDGNWPSPGLVAGYAVTGTAGPETRFSWGPADERNIPGLFLSQRWATQQGGYWDGQRWMIADVNGDGLPDLINVFNDNGSTSVDVHLSTGTGFGSARWATHQGGYWDGQRWMVADVNGDGKADLINVFNDNGSTSVDVHLSTGSGFGWARWATQQGGYWDGQRWMVADVNGDGRADLVNVFNDNGLTSVDVHLSTGSGFGWTRWATQQGGYWDGQRWMIADVNGDGLPDLINVFNDNGSTSVDVHLSTGSGFGSARWATQQGGYWDAQRWMVADVDADGRADLINVFNDNGSTSVDVHLSTGSGFGSARWATHQGGYWDGQRWMVADVNGDGKADLINVFNDNGSTSVDVHPCETDLSGLVTAITLPTEGIILIAYATALQIPGLVDPSESNYPLVANSGPRQFVLKISTSNGEGETLSTSYSYSNGLVLSGFPWARQDLGFASTRATVDSTGAYVMTYYRQDPPYAGLVDRVDTYGSDGRLYKAARNYYSSTTRPPHNSSDPSITFVFKTAQEELNYNGETTADIYREEYAYDTYGNLTLTDNKGSLANPLDEVQTATTYATNTSSWIFLPSTKTTSAYGLNDTWGVAEKEQYFYDNLPSGQVSRGLLTSRILGLGATTATQTLGYDANGNMIWTRDGRANAGAYTTYTTSMTIDPAYHAFVTSTTNALGQTTTTAYDNLMRPVSTTDPNNQLSSVIYDVFSRQVATIAPMDSTSNPTSRTVYFEWWFRAMRTQRTTGSATIDSYVYFDGFGRTIQTKQQSVNGGWVTQDTYYDGAGRACKTSVPYLTTTYSYTTRDAGRRYTMLEYDAIGRVWQRKNTDGTSTQTFHGKTWIATIDENGHVTAQNAIDRRTTEDFRYRDIYPNQAIYSRTIIKKAFDGERITDSNGNTMQTTLDALGRKIALSDPDMGSWSYSYDANGNVVSQTDAKGQTRTFQYDFLNRILKKLYPDGTSVTYTYDETNHGVAPIGHTTTMSFPGGADYFYYDGRGRVTSSTRVLGGQSRSVAYTYDSMDRVTSQTYPDGEVVSTSYDARGNIAALTGGGSYSYVSGIQYTTNNKVSIMVYGNSVKTQYDYFDDSNKPDQSAGTTYSYRLRGISITNGLSTIANTSYQYDKKDNVMLKDFTDGARYYTEHFGYDESDRLVSAQSPDLYGSKTYQYDLLDNITSKDGRAYTYGAARPHAVLSDGTYTYSYDANGNMTYRSDGRTISYDFENRVVSIFNIGMYSYDADGQRAIKTESGATTYYFFPGYEERQQSGRPTVAVKYYFANGMRIAERSSADGLLFYHTDHLGSAVRITDANGTIVKSIAYDPYGADAYSVGTPNTTHKYTDQEQDVASGLYYYGARYYDAVLGRFISPDSMLQGLNRYTYCGGNPVKYNDPSGHFFGIDDLLIGLIVGACVVAGAYVGGSIANNNWNPVQWNWSNPSTYFGMAFGGAAGFLGGQASLAAFGLTATSISASLGLVGAAPIVYASTASPLQSTSGSANAAAMRSLEVSFDLAFVSYHSSRSGLNLDYVSEMSGIGDGSYYTPITGEMQLALFAGLSEEQKYALLLGKLDGVTAAYPLDGGWQLNSPFGPRAPEQTSVGPTSPKHTGVDLGARLYDWAYPVWDGTVSNTGYDPLGYGYYVIVDHGHGISTLTAHFATEPLVWVGERVYRGDNVLGYAGSTGRSNGPHVHIELRINGVPWNPIWMLLGGYKNAARGRGEQ